MRKGIIIVLLMFLLVGCSKEFANPKCEVIADVEGYNTLVKEAATTIFENYYFIDLRSNDDYRNGYISNFHPNNHIVYEGTDTIDKIVMHIEQTNKAKYTAPIILIDSGRAEDETSSIVYEALIVLGYKNVKDVLPGYLGLKEAYQSGYPYSLRDGSDCGCE